MWWPCTRPRFACSSIPAFSSRTTRPSPSSARAERAATAGGVFIGEGAVQAALAAAPSSFTLHGRSPARDVRFGGGHAVFGSCSGPAFVLDGDRVRPGTLADLEATIKLGHVSSVIEFHGDSVELLDLPEEERTPRGAHARVVLSDKACEWVATTDADLDVAAAVHEVLFGAAWHDRPRGLIILNTTSPLQISAETARLLVRWARLGQPTCATACLMGGTTGPATPAGVLVVQHAEVLAALVLAQAAAEGSPFIYGGLSTMASLRTGAAHFGTPEFASMAVASVQLAHHCGLPVRAGAAVTDAHLPDAQAAAESLQGVAGALRAGSDFLFQGAGILSSFNTLVSREVRPRRRDALSAAGTRRAAAGRPGRSRRGCRGGRRAGRQLPVHRAHPQARPRPRPAHVSGAGRAGEVGRR